MLHALFSVVAIFFTTLLFNGVSTRTAELPNRPKVVNLNGCRCSDLQCECCSAIGLPNSPPRDVCLVVNLIPNEVTLRASVIIDGKNVYTGQLDPSVAPICPGPGTVCLVINHVDIQKRQVCTKLSVIFFTLVKFPCIGQQNGQLFVEPNTYS